MTSAAAGLPPWLIKTLGRWRYAYMSYIRCPPHVLQSVPAILASTNTSHHPTWNPDEH